MRAEGYNFNSAAENIAAGYGTAQAAYIGWWKSEGHRRNMYNVNHREIGNGYFYWNSSTYRHYYTMDLGRVGSIHFFTDTLFHDADNDGAYDQNEGRSGLQILLRINGTPHSQFDLSSPAGSFAIPIQSIPDGALVQVFLANPTTTTTSLSLPLNYDNYSQVTLGPSQELLAGSFVQPNSAINLGFRNLTPPTPPLAPPVLASAIDAGRIQLRWHSQTAAQSQAQWTQDWWNWNILDTGPLPGTGEELTVYDTLPPQNPTTRFYRVAVQ